MSGPLVSAGLLLVAAVPGLPRADGAPASADVCPAYAYGRK
ncbi:hypothetical protein ACH4ZX_27800 [Streptomyces sp. NPDC020490]